jgi:hypothetical protein
MNQLPDLTNQIKALRPFLPYLFALGMIGLFGYTGWTINTAFNPTPQVNGSLDKGKVKFDQATINAIISLNGNSGAVQGNSTSSGDSTSSGGSDPFGQ